MLPDRLQRLYERIDLVSRVHLGVRGDIDNNSGMRRGLKDILSDIEDGEDKKKLMDSFLEIENEERKDSEELSEFIGDPSKGLDGIEGIYDLCGTMGPVHTNNFFDTRTKFTEVGRKIF